MERKIEASKERLESKREDSESSRDTTDGEGSELKQKKPPPMVVTEAMKRKSKGRGVDDSIRKTKRRKCGGNYVKDLKEGVKEGGVAGL